MHMNMSFHVSIQHFSIPVIHLLYSPEKRLIYIPLSYEQDYKFPSGVPLDSETHGGDDVAVFASGPWAHLFSGAYEQNFIPHAMGYAACIGDGLTACSTTK